jgi:hypothetical protein
VISTAFLFVIVYSGLCQINYENHLRISWFHLTFPVV